MKQKLCEYFNGKKTELKIKCWAFPGCHGKRSIQSEGFIILQCVSFSLVIDPNTFCSRVAIPDTEFKLLDKVLAFYGFLEVAPKPQQLHRKASKLSLVLDKLLSSIWENMGYAFRLFYWKYSILLKGQYHLSEDL